MKAKFNESLSDQGSVPPLEKVKVEASEKEILEIPFRILLIIGAAVALIAAGIPVINSGNEWMKTDVPCYSLQEVTSLMQQNGMSRQEAEEVLALSCEFAARPE